MFKKITILSLFFLAVPALSVWASFDYTPMEKIPGFETSSDFCTYITTVYKFGLWAIGICALFMIMIGGYMYIMSAGNNASMTKAKGIIFDAIAGILLAFFSYLILYEINPDLVLCRLSGSGSNASFPPPALSTSTSSTTPTTSTSATTSPSSSESGKSSDSEAKLGSLSPACDKYDSQFNTAAQDKETQCLLKSVAMTESSCNASVGGSSAGAYGLMQIKPDTAGMTASELNDPDKSIKKASQLLEVNQAQLGSYTKFETSQGTAPGSEKITMPDGNSYYTGNDDLIASYNGGGGTKASDGKLGPFAESVACKERPGYPYSMPAWQCPYVKPYPDETKEGKGEGYDETRQYVQKVQNYQKQCLGT